METTMSKILPKMNKLLVFLDVNIVAKLKLGVDSNDATVNLYLAGKNVLQNLKIKIKIRISTLLNI